MHSMYIFVSTTQIMHTYKHKNTKVHEQNS